MPNMSLTRTKRKQRITIESGSEDLFKTVSPAKTTPNKRKKKNNDILEDKSIFGDLVSKSGLVLMKGDQPNLLKCDQAIFQKNFKKTLLVDPNYGVDCVDRFLKALENHIEDIVKFKWTLLYTQTAPDCQNCRGGQQDSVMRILLNIDELQPKLITILTEKLLEIAYDESEGDKVDIPRLILANIRWLDHIVDPETLSDKIVDLLEGSPLEIQKDVINFAPNIADDQHHPNIAKVFGDLYETTPELTPFLLDSLSYLVLEPGILEDFHHSVLKTLQSVKSKNLAVVIKFLLHSTSSSQAHQVTSEIREKIRLPGESRSSSKLSQLPSIASSSSHSRCSRVKKEPPKESDLEILIFSNIKTAILIHKYLAVTWLKSISEVQEMDKIRSFDLLILAVIYQVIPPRRKAIESLLRNLVRLGLPIEPLLPNTFANHPAVLVEYFDAVKKLADQLIRSIEMGVSRFGTAMYKYSFINLESFQQQDVVLSLLSHLGDNENVRWRSLNLLSQLAHEETAQMSKYILFLKGSLEVMDTLTLRESKKLMDALIHLAYFSQDESSLKEELNILIRKQLSHTDIKFKRLGVLSAVLTLKNSVCDDDINIDGDQDSETINTNGFSGGPLKDAEALFHLVMESTQDSPHSSALFMDEFATNILKHGLNSLLEKWISNKLSNDFEATFILNCVDEIPDDDFPVPVSFQWNLEESQNDSEQNEPLAIGVAKFVLLDLKAQMGNENKGTGRILKMAPHFRLMRMVVSHLFAGDLDDIGLLLGCGVQMPSPEIYDKFSSLSDSEKDFVLTCLFYAVNWFRELVNAFVTQKDPEQKRKVTLRFKKLIILHDMVGRLLPQAPAYVPPPFLFDFDVTYASNNNNIGSGNNSRKAKTKGPQKGTKKKGNKDKNETLLSGISQTLGTQVQTPKATQTAGSAVQPSEVAHLSKLKFHFRELHLDVFKLLFKKMSLEADVEEERIKYLCLEEVEFLILDLNKKLSRVFESGSKRATVLGKSGAERDAGFTHFDVFTASEVSGEALRYIKPVCAHLEVISQFFQALIDDNDGIEDASNMFTERTHRIASLYSALFTSLKIFLSWSSLRSLDNATTLSSILIILGKNVEGNTVSQMAKEQLLATSFRYLSKFSDSVIFISTAVNLVELLDVILTFTKDVRLRAKLVELTENFLKKDWYTFGGNRDKGASYNRNIISLLKVFFRHSADSVSAINSMATHGIKELSKSSAKDPISELYPTMKKSTLFIYYSVLLENLVTGTQKLLTTTSTDDAGDDAELEIWNLSIKTLYVMVEPLKLFSSTHIFAACLKHCHGYLKLFLQRGMPLLDGCLKSKQSEVTSILKNLQMTTRFLHHLCTHAKCNQEKRMVQFVPLLKRSLETIVFRVKAMLAVNHCQNAFWMGNLKNRDLHGEEILSQSIQEETSSNAEDEQEVLEDELSDVDLEVESNSDKDRFSISV